MKQIFTRWPADLIATVPPVRPGETKAGMSLARLDAAAPVTLAMTVSLRPIPRLPLG
ncbi:MAG TPA: hypothetical protein VND19_18050 [Acetobacteraceae bacterium]|nr:hypothetical protein [Acetobacteraceae bacterium]